MIKKHNKIILLTIVSALFILATTFALADGPGMFGLFDMDPDPVGGGAIVDGNLNMNGGNISEVRILRFIDEDGNPSFRISDEGIWGTDFDRLNLIGESGRINFRLNDTHENTAIRLFNDNYEHGGSDIAIDFHGTDSEGETDHNHGRIWYRQGEGLGFVGYHEDEGYELDLKITEDGNVGIRGDLEVQGEITGGGGSGSGSGDSHWSKSGSDLYYNDGNVGIGRDDPEWPIDIYGENPWLRLMNNDGGTVYVGAFHNTQNTALWSPTGHVGIVAGGREHHLKGLWLLDEIGGNTRATIGRETWDNLRSSSTLAIHQRNSTNRPGSYIEMSTENTEEDPNRSAYFGISNEDHAQIWSGRDIHFGTNKEGRYEVQMIVQEDSHNNTKLALTNRKNDVDGSNVVIDFHGTDSDGELDHNPGRIWYIHGEGLGFVGHHSGGSSHRDLLIREDGTTEMGGDLDMNGNQIYGQSDINFKENIQPLENPLNSILELNGVNYNWRVDEYPTRNFDDKTQIGLIAQDVEKVIPELVKTDEQGYKSIYYNKFTPILIEGIKEQQKHIEQLEKEIDELKKEKERIDKLEEKLEEITNTIKK